MTRVVFDTNIFISGFLFKGNQRLLLECVLEGKIRVILSKPLFHEIGNVLTRPKFKLAQEKVDLILNEIEALVEFVYPFTKVPNICRDPKDHIVLECALEGKAEYIITGDMDLLILKEYKGIPIIDSNSMLLKLTSVNPEN